MQWAVAAHGPAGKVRADRRTIEYTGRGNHARDAACFRTTRPVSAAPQATKQTSTGPQRQQQTNHKRMAKVHKTLLTVDERQVISAVGGSVVADGHGASRGSAVHDTKETLEDDAVALSLSKLRVFYYETLVVSTRDDDESEIADEDESEKDARAELDLLMARANAAAAAINNNTSSHPQATVTRAAATAPHPYLNASTHVSRLPWRERARRIVHANLRAADSLAQGNSSSSSDENEGDDETIHDDGDDHRMDLDSIGSTSAANSNGHDDELVPAARSTTNGGGGRSIGIRQFLSATSSAMPSGAAGTSLNHHSRLLSLTGGASNDPRSSSNTHSRSRSSSNNSSGTSGINNNNSSSTSSTNMSSVANGVHFAFTLSSRTLQQIRSRHERRRMRRHQEKKRFNHRIGIGFMLASKSNQGPSAHDGLSQVSTSSSSSASPLKKLASYQQQSKQVHHVDLGKDSFSLAYHGKTGRIMSNGQVFLQCERFGSGDVVGCGILLDTKTFFFTLNGRLLGMLAATDVHHFDDFVDDAASHEGGVIFGDNEEESGAEFVADEDDSDESDEEIGDRSQREATLFEDVLYPAVSLHDAGECACANFNEFQFDLACFERQILKERQQALLLHEIADEREEEANDRVINKLIQNYFLHYGYKDAYTVFQTSVSFLQAGGDSTSALDSEGIDVDIDEEEKSEPMDTGSTSSPVGASDAVQIKLLDLRHVVRQHIYAFQTQEALAKVRAALGDAFFQSVTKRRRSDKVLFYCSVLCVLDVLLAQQSASPSGRPGKAKAKAKAVNGDIAADRNGNGYESRDSACWNAEEAILCAQDQFASYLVGSSARTQPAAAAGEDRDMDATTNSSGSSRVAESVVDDELELVMSLLLYERQEDVPAASVARKFISPKFREHVADELNVLLLVNNSSPGAKKTVSDGHQRRRFSPPPALAAASTRRDGSASALQNFLVELNSLQSQCLRNGCRVFPGNHTVSSGKHSSRSSSRRRRRHASESSSDNGEANNGDEEMRSSSSGSDMSSSSSRSENDDDDDEEEEE